MWRIDFEIDGLPVDTLVVSCYPGGLILYFAPHLGKVIELSSGYVEEFAPFLLAGYTGRSMRNMDFIVVFRIIAFAGEVDELKDKRSACYDAATSRQKISTDNVFEYR